jgi:hypothetical protein
MSEDCQNKVSMQGFALGGSSELNPVEDFLMSGLEEMVANSNTLVSKEGEEFMLQGKDMFELQSAVHARVNTQRHHHHRGIGGSASSDKIELLLALLVLKMTAQGIDRMHFDDWIKKKRCQWKDYSDEPEYSFMNRCRVLACGDEPNFKSVTLLQIQEAADMYQCACDLYDRAFKADPTEFTFVFTGDIGDKDTFKKLLLKYVGKLWPKDDLIGRIGCWLPENSPPSDGEANVVCRSQLYPFTLYDSSNVEIDGPIEESLDLLKKDDIKSSMMIIFRADMNAFVYDDDDVAHSTALDAACRVLQICLLDELRIKMGKVYNVHVEKTRNSLCSFFLISIGLYCHASDMGVIKESIKSVLCQLQSAGPQSDTIKSVCEAMHKTHSDATSNPSYWLFWILDSYKAFKLHKWRCTTYPEDVRFKDEESCAWLERNGVLRATGKMKSIREDINCDVVHDIYKTTFDMNKSIVISLIPKLLDEDEETRDMEQREVSGTSYKDETVEVMS